MSSLQARVPLTLTCNQNCGFCNQRAPVHAPIDVKGLIDSSTAEEILLSGGEPTLRKDLPGIVAYAKKKARVVLETNGALLDEARVQALQRAGLDRVRIHLPAWGDACDAITRDPGGFVRTRAAIELFQRARIAIEFVAPIVRANRELLPLLPEKIVGLGSLCLNAPVSAPDPSTLLPLEEAAQVLAQVAAAAREVGVTVRVDPAAPIPPCLMPEPARVGYLFSLTRGGAERADHHHVSGCAECAVVDRCPGVPVGVPVKPIRDDRTRRRLTMISTVEAQIEREFFAPEVHRLPDGTTVNGGLVRVNFSCNQACRFCFVSTHLPAPPDSAIEAAIARVGDGVLTISGGEPTLNSRLVEWVKLGRQKGARRIDLQTNAIRLADARLTQALAEAGLDAALVSFHAADAATSDRITEAPGTFDKTVRGIDELAKNGVDVRLNFVFCEANREKFPELVDFVGARWPKATIVVSFVGPSTELVPREASLIPRYRDVLPFLAEGIKRARVPVMGFESMCGIPLCLVPDDLSSYFQLAEVKQEPGEFIKTDTCKRCSLESRCWGIRRGYAELHGTEELHAIG